MVRCAPVHYCASKRWAIRVNQWGYINQRIRMPDSMLCRSLLLSSGLIGHAPSRASTVGFIGYRLTKSIRPMTSTKVSGSTITSGVHCLVHDVVIRSLTL